MLYIYTYGFQKSTMSYLTQKSLRCNIGESGVLMYMVCIGNSCKFNRKCHTFIHMDFRNLQCRTWLKNHYGVTLENLVFWCIWYVSGIHANSIGNARHFYAWISEICNIAPLSPCGMFALEYSASITDVNGSGSARKPFARAHTGRWAWLLAYNIIPSVAYPNFVCSWVWQ